MRIAHVSDLHLFSLEGAIPWRLFNKRLTGYANLRLRRKHVHRAELVRAIARRLRDENVDHVCITGDVSNLALEVEFQLARRLLDDELGLAPEHVSIVPGNHDVYTGGSQRSRRFYSAFEPYLRSDLPELAAESPAGRFPVVKLRGPVAFIGLSTAVSQPPFVAAGRLGKEQLAALERVLDHPAVRGRTPIVLQHHPAHRPDSKLKAAMEGLADASDLARVLSRVRRGLVLHGHLHTRIRQPLGAMHVVGATSASLEHESAIRMAGYNLYEIDDEGAVRSIESRAVDRASGGFVSVEVPTGEWH
jgi:3',5'-cyclic AMP phosphodiesterase CpdA